MTAPNSSSECYRIGDLILDLEMYRVTRAGKELTLPKLSFDLLATLASRAPAVTTIRELMDEVWGDVVVGEETVVQRVKLLREVLKADNQETQYIENVRGRGYKLAVPVEVISEQDAAGAGKPDGVPSFLAELQRRRVLQVAGAYVVGAWIILQLADIVVPELSLPGWTMRLILVMLTIGFPIALLLAWAFQVTPTGVVQDASPTDRRTGALIGIGGLLIGIGLGGAWLLSGDGEPRLASRKGVTGIAVLPFTDMSRDSDQAYFSDGLHEELLSSLANLGLFRVPSRTSVEAYRETKKKAREIAEELGVEAVVEGSARHSEGQVVVTVQLIDGRADDHLWVQNYDRELSMENLFDIQRELATLIANSLGEQLSPEQEERVEELPTTSLAAYDAYLKGNYYALRYNSPDLRKAQSYFERAAELDPNFAGAWSGLAFTYSFGATGYGWLRPRDAIGPAKEYAARALELAPERAATLSLLGSIHYWFERDWRAGERYYMQALESEPQYVGARLSYAYLLSSRNRHDEAIGQIRMCLDLEPRSAMVHANAAWRYMNARQYALAIEHANETLSIDPRFPDAIISRSWALIFSGGLEEALEDLEASDQSADVLGFALAMSGRVEEAREQLRQFATPAPGERVVPVSAAIISIGLGDHDQAFEWLERAVEDQHRDVLQLDVWEVYDPLRSDRRFDELLERVGLRETEPK